MERNDVIKWLSKMTEKQIVEFFYEALAERDTSDIEGASGHFVIAEPTLFQVKDVIQISLRCLTKMTIQMNGMMILQSANGASVVNVARRFEASPNTRSVLSAARKSTAHNRGLRVTNDIFQCFFQCELGIRMTD